jgi:hypothetical protein
MDLADVLRQFKTEDEDFKVVQMLGLRLFNSFASSIKLMLSGYSQSSVMLLRDILETVFLLDFFRTNREAIAPWRLSDKQRRLKEFLPIRIREALDHRDGFKEKRREKMYDQFSELAAHPTMQSVAMLRPKGMDARNGPFIDPTALEAVASEMGRLAIQAGEKMDAFFPPVWPYGDETRLAFSRAKPAGLMSSIRDRRQAANGTLTVRRQAHHIDPSNTCPHFCWITASAHCRCCSVAGEPG